MTDIYNDDDLENDLKLISSGSSFKVGARANAKISVSYDWGTSTQTAFSNKKDGVDEHLAYLRVDMNKEYLKSLDENTKNIIDSLIVKNKLTYKNLTIYDVKNPSIFNEQILNKIHIVQNPNNEENFVLFYYFTKDKGLTVRSFENYENTSFVFSITEGLLNKNVDKDGNPISNKYISNFDYERNKNLYSDLYNTMEYNGSKDNQTSKKFYYRVASVFSIPYTSEAFGIVNLELPCLLKVSYTVGTYNKKKNGINGFSGNIDKNLEVTNPKNSYSASSPTVTDIEENYDDDILDRNRGVILLLVRQLLNEHKYTIKLFTDKTFVSKENEVKPTKKSNSESFTAIKDDNDDEIPF